MFRFLLALAAVVSLQAAGSAGAADRDGPYFVELGAAPWMGAIRFVEAEPLVASGQTPEPTLNLLVVLTDRADDRRPGVAYFQLKQRIDCRSHEVTIVSYTAWSADGSAVREDFPMKYAGGPDIDAYWRRICGPPSISIPPMVVKAGDAPPLAAGVKGALDLAKRREADLDAISRLPDEGPYVAYSHPVTPKEGALLLDVGHLARNGPALTASWLLLPPPTAHLPGYVRFAYAADCSAQTGARVVEGGYDEHGVLIRLYGPEPSAALASMGGFGRVLMGICDLPLNPRFPATYPNVAAALEAGRAMLVRDLGPAPSPPGPVSGPGPGSEPPRPEPAVAPQPPPLARPVVLQNPDWEQLPTGDELAALYPAAARAKGVGGSARMRCVVLKDGRLTDCAIISETPPDQGFGAATLATAHFFKMRPTTPDGQPTEGGVVVIPLTWALAPG